MNDSDSNIAGDEEVAGEQEESQKTPSDGFRPWDASQQLTHVSPREVEHSTGFLQCKPELWFPGFSAHWHPLLLSLGVEVELASVEPSLSVEANGNHAFVGGLDGDPVSLLLPPETFEYISRTYVPEAQSAAKHLVVEYFARRLLTSLVLSCSAFDGAQFLFESDSPFQPERHAGSVKLVFRIHGEEVVAHIALGERVLQKFDELWVSHITQGSSGTSGEMPVKLVFGASYVSPSEMEDVMAPGKYIPITSGGPKEAFLFLHDEPWMKAELLYADGVPAARIVSELDELPGGPSGTTQVLFEAGTTPVSRTQLLLLSQSGSSLLLTGSPELSSQTDVIDIFVSGQNVAKGRIVSLHSELFIEVVG